MCLGVLVQRKRERDSVCGCRFLFGRKSLVDKLRVCVGGREREELGEFVLSWLGEIDTSTHSFIAHSCSSKNSKTFTMLLVH